MSMSKERSLRTCPALLLILLLAACSAPGRSTSTPRPMPGTDQPRLRLSDSGLPASLPPETPSILSSGPLAPTPTATSLPNVPTASAPTVMLKANLRAGLGIGYPIVGSVTPGEGIHIVATNRDRSWYELDGGQWIFGELVAGPPAALQVEMKIPPTPVPSPVPKATRPEFTLTATPGTASAYTGPAGCEGRSGLRYGAICKDGSTSQETGDNACSQQGGVQAWTVCP